jgi:hypothetical protein
MYKCECGSTLITETWTGDVITKWGWKDGKPNKLEETSDNGTDLEFSCTECGAIIEDDDHEKIMDLLYN